MSNVLKQEKLDVKYYSKRFKYYYLFLAFVFLLISGRLLFLQVIKGDQFRQFSDNNRIKKTKLFAPRGLILDRENRVLVKNQSVHSAIIIPQYAKELKKTITSISEFLDINIEDTLTKIKKNRRKNGTFRPVIIKNSLNFSELSYVRRVRRNYPGLDIQSSLVREYPLKDVSAHIFGYVGRANKSELNKAAKNNLNLQLGDSIGKNGLEKLWDETVRGSSGLSYVEVDARGRETAQKTSEFLKIHKIDAEPGKSLVLTLDKDIQEAAYKAFNRDDKIGYRRGSVVAMKANGEILAFANSPSFDPNLFSFGISNKVWNGLRNDKHKPLRNRAIQDHYPPGSTFKPLMALIALEKNIIKEYTPIKSPGLIRFGKRNYHDHNRGGHGVINVKTALEKSSNVFFYKMGISLGIDNIFNYSKLFNLGSRTGIDIPSENPGILPSREWKKKLLKEPWQPGENLNTAIGQGFTRTTLLQMVNAYNTIGQEGLLYKPFIVKAVTGHKNKTLKSFEPKLIRDIKQDPNFSISQKNFDIVKRGMKKVVHGEKGTAKWYKLKEVTMAGKTGTAQVRRFSSNQIYKKCENRPYKQRHHGWFIAFAPAENPEIAVGVIAEHSCHGSSGAAPIVRDIVDAYFKKYHPELYPIEKETEPSRKLSTL